MAKFQEKWDDNAPGPYYVDQSCIMCNLCMEVAPSNFVESDEGDHHVVSKQPESMDEEGKIREAMEQCPVEAVGDDGVTT